MEKLFYGMPHLLDLAPELLDEILGYVLANDDRDDDNVSRTNVTYYPETKSYRPRLIPLATTCPQFYELNRRRSAGNPRCELLMCFETDATPADDFNDRKIKVYQEYDNLRKGECRNLMILGTKVAEQSQLGYFDTLDWGNPSGSLCDCDNCHRQWTCDILNARPAGQDKISRVIHSLLPHFTNVTTASFHDDDYGIPLPTFAEGIRTLVQGCLGLTELFINVAFSFQNPFESYRIEELDTSKPYARLSVLRLQLKLETGWPEMPAMLPHVNGSPRLLGALRRILEFPSKTVETFQLSTIGPWIEFPHEGGEDYLVEEGGQDGHWGLPSIKTLDIYLNESVVGSLRLDRVFYLGPNITNLKMAVEGPKPLQCDCESDRTYLIPENLVEGGAYFAVEGRVGNVDFRDKFKKCFNSEIEMYGGLNKTLTFVALKSQFPTSQVHTPPKLIQVTSDSKFGPAVPPLPISKMNRRMLTREEESAAETPVTLADQTAINTFSILHSRHSVLTATLTEKRTEKEYLSDVTNELELSDDDDLVPYKIGDAFVSLRVEEVRELLEQESRGIDEEIEELESRVRSEQGKMDELKVQLYAKFGRSINLEA
ncbi:hypothetical protein Dda_2201 [Drechslerella dactyloides]|uniref:Uncharacterized protein n=1 Tax=Drechslerella dactyloides TaxID=74499 RepID=A0AAD6NNP1_DREDA|nr:hypothetical protein Dda_2201 [Drechslerella dactyloides]